MSLIGEQTRLANFTVILDVADASSARTNSMLPTHLFVANILINPSQQLI